MVIPTFTPSPEQSLIGDFVATSSRNLCINAAAGTGKTTTECWLVREKIPNRTQKSVLMLSFSKAIVTTLVDRLPPDVQAKTFNALGHGVLQTRIGKRLNVKSDKSRTLLKDMLKWEDMELYANFVTRLVGLAKNVGIGPLVPDLPAEWFGLITKFGLTLDSGDADESRAVELARQLLAVSVAAARDSGFVDFDDQLYLPVLWNLQFQKFNYILVDEAQDTNAIQREMVKRLLAPGQVCPECNGDGGVSEEAYGGPTSEELPYKCPTCNGSGRVNTGRLIIAGDASQAIYGFRGADTDSMTRFCGEFQMEELTLSVSRRCSKAVVCRAQRYSTTRISAHEDNPNGSDKTLDNYTKDLFTPTAAILCRNTAPLIAFAFGLIGKGVGCKILGREIGTGLVTLIKSCKCSDIKELETKLITRRNREVAKARARESESAVAAIEDKYDCLNIFLQHADTVEELCSEILELFDESRRGLLTLATIHKAKGLEWEVVFPLDFNLLPSRWVKTSDQHQQERNLQYVCVTRAKRDLNFITSNCWRKEGDVKCPDQQSIPSSLLGDQMIPPESNPPPTFNPDAVELYCPTCKTNALRKWSSTEIDYCNKCQGALQPPAQLSSDTASDDWFSSHQYDSVRTTSNPDKQ